MAENIKITEAYTQYYDDVSDEELAEQEACAEFTSSCLNDEAPPPS